METNLNRLYACELLYFKSPRQSNVRYYESEMSLMLSPGHFPPRDYLSYSTRKPSNATLVQCQHVQLFEIKMVPLALKSITLAPTQSSDSSYTSQMRTDKSCLEIIHNSMV